MVLSFAVVSATDKSAAAMLQSSAVVIQRPSHRPLVTSSNDDDGNIGEGADGGDGGLKHKQL